MPEMDGIETARALQKMTELDVIPKVIMVSAYDRAEVAAHSHDVDIARYLLKPVHADILAEAMVDALGHKSKSGESSPSEPEEAQQWQGYHLLVVEDNELNQILAREVLQQAGFQVTVVDNGQAGLDALEDGHFDAVLMDVQMPLMDGYTATRLIRENPRTKALPVIAMTANVLAGDREKAFASGMDDYVSKPLDLNHLFAVLRRVLAGEAAIRQTVEPVGMPEPESVQTLDMAQALRVAGNDRELVTRLQIKFLESLANFSASFEAALADQRYTDALRLVHTVKGTASNVGATALAAAAALVETACRQDRPSAEHLAPLLLSLRDRIGETSTALHSRLGSDIADRYGEADLSDEKWADLLDQLHEALLLSDTAALPLVKSLLAIGERNGHGPTLARIAEAVDHYDFEAGLAELESMLQAGRRS